MVVHSDSSGITILNGIVKVVTSRGQIDFRFFVSRVRGGPAMSKTNPVACSHGSCGEPAAYKIAARWSDGRSGRAEDLRLCMLGTCRRGLSRGARAAARLRSWSRGNRRRAGNLPLRARETRPLPATIVGIGRELPVLTRAGISKRHGRQRCEARRNARVDSRVTLRLRYERSDWRSHREAYCAWISVVCD